MERYVDAKAILFERADRHGARRRGDVRRRRGRAGDARARHGGVGAPRRRAGAGARRGRGRREQRAGRGRHARHLRDAGGAAGDRDAAGRRLQRREPRDRGRAWRSRAGCPPTRSCAAPPMSRSRVGWRGSPTSAACCAWSTTRTRPTRWSARIAAMRAVANRRLIVRVRLRRRSRSRQAPAHGRDRGARRRPGDRHVGQPAHGGAGGDRRHDPRGRAPHERAEAGGGRARRGPRAATTWRSTGARRFACAAGRGGAGRRGADRRQGPRGLPDRRHAPSTTSTIAKRRRRRWRRRHDGAQPAPTTDGTGPAARWTGRRARWAARCCRSRATRGADLRRRGHDSRAVAPGQLFFAFPGERVDGFDFAAQAAAAGAAGLVVPRDARRAGGLRRRPRSSPSTIRAARWATLARAVRARVPRPGRRRHRIERQDHDQGAVRGGAAPARRGAAHRRATSTPTSACRSPSWPRPGTRRPGCWRWRCAGAARSPTWPRSRGRTSASSPTSARRTSSAWARSTRSRAPRASCSRGLERGRLGGACRRPIRCIDRAGGARARPIGALHVRRARAPATCACWTSSRPGTRGSVVRYARRHVPLVVRLPLAGEHNARNGAAALAVAHAAGVAPLAAAAALEKVALPPHRSRDAGRRRPHDPGRLLQRQPGLDERGAAHGGGGGRRRGGLGARVRRAGRHAGDRPRGGGAAPRARPRGGRSARGRGRRWATSPRRSPTARAPPAWPRNRTQIAGSPEEAAAVMASWTAPGDWILVKASRGMRLERVVEALRGRLVADRCCSTSSTGCATTIRAFNVFRYVSTRIVPGDADVAADHLPGRALVHPPRARAPARRGDPRRRPGRARQQAGHADDGRRAHHHGAGRRAPCCGATSRSTLVWLALLVTVGYGAIGFVDDYLKLAQEEQAGRAGQAQAARCSSSSGAVAMVWLFYGDALPPEIAPAPGAAAASTSTTCRHRRSPGPRCRWPPTSASRCSW